MVTKTFKQLREADTIVAKLYERFKELEHGKFGYAWKRFAEKNYAEYLKEFQRELGDIRVDNALEDKETKAILRDKENHRGYQYSKAGEKKVIEQENALVKKWEEKEIEVEPYYIQEESLPVLDQYERESLEGMLIEAKPQEAQAEAKAE